MTEETTPATTPVDRDAGEGWDAETILLDHPIKFQGVTYHSVTLRAPTGVDAISFYDSKKPSVADFACRLLGGGQAFLGALHGADAAKIIKRASAFLG